MWFATLYILQVERSKEGGESFSLCGGIFLLSSVLWGPTFKAPKILRKNKVHVFLWHCNCLEDVCGELRMSLFEWGASPCLLSDPCPLCASMRHPQILSKWASGSLALSLLYLCLSLSPLLNERQNPACPSIPYPQSHVPLSSVSSLGSFGKSEFRLDNFSSLWGAIFTCNFC